ncbi:hypothetical protein C7271_21485 [filamentous cyanobacterium CCP5]|nr:hypothetical protein C7271_21485 [filamentous cyanobacterium CCP5]
MNVSRFYLIAVFVVVAAIAALVAQNPTPVLALNFLGGQTLALPLALWLLLALACGALTVLLLSLLLPGPRRSKYRPTAYSRFAEEPRQSSAAAGGGSVYRDEGYGPQGPSSRESAYDPYPQEPEPYTDYMVDPVGGRSDDDGEWGAWTQLRSPAQRSDWDQPAPRVDLTGSPGPRSSQSGRSIPTGTSGWNLWPFGNSAANQQQQAESSFQDLAEGWDGVEDQDYRPGGGSPVQDALDDIDQGWEGSGEGAYAYGYGPEDSRRDNVYAPPDPEEDWIGEGAEADDPEAEGAEVVDADYRVIIPPYSAAEDANEEATDENQPP